MILDDAEKKIQYFNRIGIHYESVYHYLIRNSSNSFQIFSPQIIDDITAGLISFDMQRMMGKPKFLCNGNHAWAFRLFNVLRKFEKELSELKRCKLQDFDFNDIEAVNKIMKIFDDLSKKGKNSLNLSSQQRGFQTGASKILHFLIPDLFIIVDSNARSELSKYYGFSKYRRVDGKRYVDAMELYKEELIKWVHENDDKNFSKLLTFDSSWKKFSGTRETPLTRIIDKCSFVGDKKFYRKKYLPLRFNTYIGGYMGGSFKIELYGNSLIYTYYKGGFKFKESKTINPTKMHWETFSHKIDEIGIWEWKSEYPNKNTLDGTQWSFEIQYEDKYNRSHGDNQYPGPNGSSSFNLTNEFESFLKAIRELVRGLPFH
jgi:hypothetical protein